MIGNNEKTNCRQLHQVNPKIDIAKAFSNNIYFGRIEQKKMNRIPWFLVSELREVKEIGCTVAIDFQRTISLEAFREQFCQISLDSASFFCLKNSLSLPSTPEIENVFVCVHGISV